MSNIFALAIESTIHAQFFGVHICSTAYTTDWGLVGSWVGGRKRMVNRTIPTLANEMVKLCVLTVIKR